MQNPTRTLFEHVGRGVQPVSGGAFSKVFKAIVARVRTAPFLAVCHAFCFYSGTGRFEALVSTLDDLTIYILSSLIGFSKVSSPIPYAREKNGSIILFGTSNLFIRQASSSVLSFQKYRCLHNLYPRINWKNSVLKRLTSYLHDHNSQATQRTPASHETCSCSNKYPEHAN